MTSPRIGFCCKWIDHPDECAGRKPTSESRHLNGRSTTMRWLREHATEAEQRQWDIMNHNAQAALNLVERVGSLEPHLRMVRLGSEMLQGYTEPSWINWWQQADVQSHLERIFAPIGARARELGVRLSFHPGQFCVLASANENIVERSIAEFEYHADMARWMGYGKKFQDFKINVHISGKRGPEGIRQVLGRLSTEARNCITIENEENSWGLDDCLTLSDVVPIVLDVHHFWCREGKYIDPNSDSVKRILDSWRGVRPAMHYSVSREDVLVGHDVNVLPDMSALLAAGYKKQKLRAHSDFYWNSAVNEWAASFLPLFDIQTESKGKNLSRDRFAAYAVKQI
jgi:UV DNA damage repair endonuclease